MSFCRFIIHFFLLLNNILFYVCIALSIHSPTEEYLPCFCSCMLSCSVTPNSLTPWTAACQASLYMWFSRYGYWRRLPFPTPGHLPDPRTEAVSPALAGEFFSTEPPGKPPFAFSCWVMNIGSINIYMQVLCGHAFPKQLLPQLLDFMVKIVSFSSNSQSVP